jgi:putative ABC transport system permease protein
VTRGRAGLWLRWSWRDLRARWLQVAAIASIIAVGTGVYAGLSATGAWRRQSYDASYAALAAHDVRVELAAGTDADPVLLTDALAGLVGPTLETVEARLIVPTQVDASRGGRTILVPGRLVGVDVADGGPHVDAVHTTAGRGLRATDAGAPRVVLDEHFADHYDLPPSGSLRLSGGVDVDFVGRGLSPEYFLVVSDSGSLLAEAGYAVAFAPLDTVQRLSGRGGVVNDLVIRAAAGVGAARAAREVEAALAEALPDVAVEVTTLEDDRVHALLYDDIEGDQRLYNIFAVLILGGAAFAAFTLVGRIVEAQRRELGIGMALGVPRVRLAVRPLLVGAQVSLLGAALGVAMGTWIDAVFAGFLRDYFPLPVWRTGFQVGEFARGAALGAGLPLAASVVPVWRAVRVTPMEAIATGPRRVARRGARVSTVRILRDRSTTAALPLRNLLRSPRRTVLTALAIAASVATLVSVIGMVDSFVSTIDRGEVEILGDAPDRLDVQLDGFVPVASPVIGAITAAPTVGTVEPVLQIPGTLRTDGDPIDALLTFRDLGSDRWRPTIVSGSLAHEGPGLVVAEKAARDLGVSVGDEVVVRHPRREGVAGYRFVESSLPVAGIHPNPYRFAVYLDLDDSAIANLDGIVNGLSVEPAAGATVEDVQRDLFGREGVASVQPVAALITTIREAIDESIGLLDVVEVMVLVLALLIAFNSSSISADERARDHATMFAFGLRLRTVVRMAVVEHAVIGVLGTAVGVATGYALLGWIFRFLLPTTLPELGITVDVAGGTLVTAAALGIVAVSLAPVLTVRKLRRTDLPSTLRVVE